MGLRLKAFALGTVEVNPVDTASNLSVNVQAATGGLYLPVGTTAQRPASPATGQMRFNTTTGSVETYNGTSWS